MESTNPVHGPVAYENWHSFEKGSPWGYSAEVPLYSDAVFTGQIESYDGKPNAWGPYTLFNTISMIHPPGCLPVFVLRIDYHGDKDQSYFTDNTDTTRYHGGNCADEIASLIGLATGTRIKPSSDTRHFIPDSKLGRPCSEDPFSVPFLPPRHIERPPRIATEPTAQIDAGLLKNYPSYEPSVAVALVRAARQYQNALWICESSPENAWLMLVSSIEVAAVCWRLTSDEPVKLLQRLEPKWVEKLKEAGGDELVKYFASKWNPLIKSSDRFVKFLMEYLPDAPLNRPDKHDCVEWTSENLEVIFKRLYGFRSSALHAGIPFPAPLCEVPQIFNNQLLEKPMGLASMTRGGTWTASDLPMFLHVFAYIVRGALLKWWRTIDQKVAQN